MSTLAELEPPAAATDRGPVERALPFLWTAVVLLLLTAIVAALVHEEPATPEERVAAAQGTATAEDFAFSMEVEVSGPGPLEAVRGTGAYDADTRRVQGTIQSQGIESAFVSDGLVQYIRLPDGLRSPGQKPWLRVDLAKLGVPAREASPASPAANPIEALRALGAIVGDVERVGTEEVRGADTTHLRFVADVTKSAGQAADLVPPDQREQLRRVPIDLWLDGDDRVRRIRQTLTVGPEATKQTVTFETFDLGKAVSVELPSADEVQELDLSNPAAAFGS
jgi:hypothetical protein